MLLLSGCAQYVQKADKLNAKHLQMMQAIGWYADIADKEAAYVMNDLVHAATQPALIADARKHLVATTQAIGHIKPTTRAAQATSDAESKNTKNAVTDLKKEQDHWLGYKTRVTLWVVGSLGVIGIVVYLVITMGSGIAFLPAILALGKTLLSLAASVATYAVHVLTLGFSYIALKVKAKNAPVVLTPVVPANDATDTNAK